MQVISSYSKYQKNTGKMIKQVDVYKRPCAVADSVHRPKLPNHHLVPNG